MPFVLDGIPVHFEPLTWGDKHGHTGQREDRELYGYRCTRCGWECDSIFERNWAERLFRHEMLCGRP